MRNKAMKKNIHKITLAVEIAFLVVFFYSRLDSFDKDLKGDNREKILLLCLDGATWRIMKPLVEKKQLPRISGLIKNGVSGHLLADPAYSPPSWTSIATGKKPEKHGVYNFSGAKERKARYLWDMLSNSDKLVGIINWVMNLPEKINGFMYQPKNYNFYAIDNEYFPDSIQAEIKKAANIKILPQFESVEGYKYWNTYDENIINISMYLIKKYKPFFVAIGFCGTNPYQHRYWSALEPQYFDISLKEFEEKKHLITDYYKKIDKFLDYFIKNNYTIFFVSDHGFCRNDRKSGPRIIKYFRLNADMQHVNFYINYLLEKSGLLTFIPRLERGGQIDFSKSKAYFYNNVKLNVGGIKINREIVTEDETVELRERINSLLKEARFKNGQKVFVNIKERASNKEYMPDIIFDLNPVFKEQNLYFKVCTKYRFRLLIFNYLLGENGEKITKIILDGRECNLGDFIGSSRDGVHEAEGVFIMSGEHIRKDRFIEYTKTFDVTPTILYLLGLPIAKDMDGKVLIEAFEPEFVKKNPIKYIETYEQNQNKKSEAEDATVKEKEILKKRLRSLGYAQ